jgi:hypothetical protein
MCRGRATLEKADSESLQLMSTVKGEMRWQKTLHKVRKAKEEMCVLRNAKRSNYGTN